MWHGIKDCSAGPKGLLDFADSEDIDGDCQRSDQSCNHCSYLLCYISSKAFAGLWHALQSMPMRVIIACQIAHEFAASMVMGYGCDDHQIPSFGVQPARSQRGTLV